MDWKSLIAELLASTPGLPGMSQLQIAEACKCGQSTISDIARGTTKDPRHSIGERLLALQREKRAAIERARVEEEAAERQLSLPAMRSPELFRASVPVSRRGR